MYDIYKNIKIRRKELHMTQEELALKVGYTNRSTIATIEAGKIDLPQSKIKQLAEALETTPVKLMGLDDWSDDIDVELITSVDLPPNRQFKMRPKEVDIEMKAPRMSKESSLKLEINGFINDFNAEQLSKLMDYAKFIKSQS